MKFKNLFIIIGAILLVIAGIWIIFDGESVSEIPSDTPVTGSPFGTSQADTVSVPAESRNFEGEVEPLPEAEASGATSDGYTLFKLSGAPVAGFVALSRSSTTIIRFADRATGHIFDTKLPVGNTNLEKIRITNNTLPQIYEAYFRADGNAVLFRSLDENDVIKNMSLSLTVPKATSTNGLYSVTLALLRGSLDGISVGTGDTLVYEAKDSKAVISSKFNGDGAKTLLSHPFTAWRTARLGAGTLLITKPSASLPGYAYNLVGGTLTKLVGPLNGLMAIANSTGTTLIYSYSGSNGLFIKDLQKKTLISITPTTLTEKCVWSAKEKNIFYCGASGTLSQDEPDSWYQGITHFSDNIWRYDTASESASLLVEPESLFGIDLDIMNPSLSSDEKYFVFINKRDLSLWALKIQ